MPYAIRNESGTLIGYAKNQSNKASEWIASDSAELMALDSAFSQRRKESLLIDLQMRLTAIRTLKTSGLLAADYPEPVLVAVDYGKTP